MQFLYSFLFCGFLCLIAQIILDKFKLLPIHITIIFVVLGAILEVFGIYDMLVDFVGGGALVPISSFGHSLTHSAVETAEKEGIIGLFSGIFDITSSGIAMAIFASFIVALIFKPRG